MVTSPWTSCHFGCVTMDCFLQGFLVHQLSSLYLPCCHLLSVLLPLNHAAIQYILFVRFWNQQEQKCCHMTPRLLHCTTASVPNMKDRDYAQEYIEHAARIRELLDFPQFVPTREGLTNSRLFNRVSGLSLLGASPDLWSNVTPRIKCTRRRSSLTKAGFRPPAHDAAQG